MVPPEFGVVAEWGAIPARISFREIVDVAVDGLDQVYLLTRNQGQVVVLDRHGQFLRSWGLDALSTSPHGITVDEDGVVYCVDEVDHVVRTFDGEGKALGTIGVPGAASPTGVDFGIRDSRERTASISRAAGPFNHPTALAIGAGGTLYITDGYGNARVHRFTRDGVLLDSWGEPGVGPGQFHIPHGIHVDGDGRVLVADRENERIQLFTADGRFVEEWSDVQRPTAIAQDAEGFIYVTELPRPAGYASWTRPASTAAASSRMSVLSRDGQVLDRIGAGEDPWKAGVLAAAHGLAIDSDGDVYVAEVRYSFGVLGAAETGEGASPHSHTFQKFARVKLPAPDS